MFRLPVLGNSDRCGAPKTAELVADALINSAVMLSEAKHLRLLSSRNRPEVIKDSSLRSDETCQVLNYWAFHAAVSRFTAEARIQSSSVRIRTSPKPARLRYVSISCGVEFCVM